MCWLLTFFRFFFLRVFHLIFSIDEVNTKLYLGPFLVFGFGQLFEGKISLCMAVLEVGSKVPGPDRLPLIR
jgi:hypothetical protein